MTNPRLTTNSTGARGRGARRLAVAAVAALAASLLGASPAHAVTGGCSVQTAAVITSGQTETSDAYLCPDNREYWAIDLKIGEHLNVDTTPAPPSAFVEPYAFDIYGPNVGTTGNFLCQSDGSGPSRVSCIIPADGRYVLVTYGAGSFTPDVKTVRAQKGRVPGACDPVNAPSAADEVTQYSNGMVCQPSGAIQFWKMILHRGDMLKADSVAIPSSGNAEPFDLQVYGPSPSGLGTHLCGNSGLIGPAFSFRCRIRKPGRYVLAASNSGSFTPLVIHPTRTQVRAPARVRVGRRFSIVATVQSDTSDPIGICLFQERSGTRWVTAGRAHTTTGVCTAGVRASHRGTLGVRARFGGAKGWGPSTSAPVGVVVG